MESVTPVRWGVMVGGSWVESCSSLSAALRREKVWEEDRMSVEVVYSTDGMTWLLLPRGSVLRPDPEPPVGARRVRWWEVWLERRRGRSPFRRRGV